MNGGRTFIFILLLIPVLGSGCERHIDPPEPQYDQLDPLVAELIETSTATVREHPGSPEAWDDLGMAYFANGLSDLAIQAFDASIELNPFRPQSQYLRGLCKMDTFDMPGALVDLQSAVLLAPNEPHPRWRAAWVAMESGNLPVAIDLSDAALEIAPDDSNSIRVRSRLYLASAEPEAGIQLLLPLVEKKGEDKHVLWLYARLLRAAGRVEEAKIYAEAAGTSTPVYSDPWAEVALQRKTGRTKELRFVLQLIASDRVDVAEDRLSRLRRYFPDDRDVVLIEGIILSRRGGLLDALDVFEQLSEQSPDWASPRHRAAVALIGENKDLSGLSSQTLEQAQALLEEVVELDPTMTKARAQLTQILVKQGEWDGVRDHLEICIEQQPLSPVHRSNLAAALLKLGRGDECLGVLDDTRDLFRKESVRSLVIRIDALVSLGRLEEAKVVFRQLSGQVPNHPAIRRLQPAFGDP